MEDPSKRPEESQQGATSDGQLAPGGLKRGRDAMDVENSSSNPTVNENKRPRLEPASPEPVVRSPPPVPCPSHSPFPSLFDLISSISTFI